MNRTSLQILHIISGLWKHTGGPASSVPGLCGALARAGCQVTLATLDGPVADAVWDCEQDGVQVQIFRPSIRHTVWYSDDMRRRLPDMARKADIIHVHGLWEYPMWLGGWLARQQHTPFVISPRGSLEPRALQRSRWKKLPVALCCDGPNLRAATCLHATADSEQRACRHFGLTNPVAVIPNGVLLPTRRSTGTSLLDRFSACRNKRVLLYMSRVNPTKGLRDFAEAWAVAARHRADWHFLMVGPDECGHAAEVLGAFRQQGMGERITYAGPLYGEERAAAFALSELSVLPTHNENFGLAVAESLAMGIPVITTHGAPWQGLIENRCGWWVPIGREGLAKALDEALALPQTALSAMGERGRAWVTRAFSWDAIADNMLSVYRWMATRQDRPPCVCGDQDTSLPGDTICQSRY